MSDDEIFCAALEHPTADRQRELVESLCSGILIHFRRVWRLLETHHRILAAPNDSQMILDRAGLVFQAFSGVTNCCRESGLAIMCCRNSSVREPPVSSSELGS